MAASASKRFYLGVGILLVIVLQVGFFLFVHSRSKLHAPSSSSSIDWDRLAVEQTERLAAWSADSPVSLKERSEWASIIEGFSTANCLTVPPDTTPVLASEVSDVELDRLHQAVTGVVEVYAEDSPELLIRYMAEQQEYLSPHRVEIVRSLVRGQPNARKEEVAQLAPEDVYIAYWNGAGIRSHWSSVLKSSGCYQFWRIEDLPGDEIRQSLGQVDSAIFQNISQFAHNFEPSHPLDAILSRDRSVLFADVKVVVQLEPELYNEPVPYFFRFWYDPAEQVWHPYQMGRVEAGDAAGESTHMF